MRPVVSAACAALTFSETLLAQADSHIIGLTIVKRDADAPPKAGLVLGGAPDERQSSLDSKKGLKKDHFWTKILKEKRLTPGRQAF